MKKIYFLFLILLAVFFAALPVIFFLTGCTFTPVVRVPHQRTISESGLPDSGWVFQVNGGWAVEASARRRYEEQFAKYAAQLPVPPKDVFDGWAMEPDPEHPGQQRLAQPYTDRRGHKLYWAPEWIFDDSALLNFFDSDSH